MSRLIDLTGKRFGRLTVLCMLDKQHYRDGKPSWRCKCDCGNVCEATGRSLREGNKKSCGCLEIENRKRLNQQFAKDQSPLEISGEKYGMLTALKPVGRSRNGDTKWLCKCDCGNFRVVAISNLRHKRFPTVDCGNHNKPRSQEAINATSKWMHENDLKQNTRLTTLTGKPRSNGTSGVCGVSWSKRDKKWVAYLQFGGQYKLRSEFKNKHDAINARKAAEEKYFKPILEKYGKEGLS
jgi:hypothetical protein